MNDAHNPIDGQTNGLERNKTKIRVLALFLFFSQLLTAESCKLHKTAAYSAKIPLIPTFYDLAAMKGLHFSDQVTENADQMERGVEPTLLVKVRSLRDVINKACSYQTFQMV